MPHRGRHRSEGGNEDVAKTLTLTFAPGETTETIAGTLTLTGAGPPPRRHTSHAIGDWGGLAGWLAESSKIESSEVIRRLQRVIDEVPSFAPAHARKAD